MGLDSVQRVRTIPALLEELCCHSECPEWLRDGIWELVNDAANRAGRTVRFDENHWKNELGEIDSDRPEILFRMLSSARLS